MCWRRSMRPIRRVKAELPHAVALLGFCGAPWTVATYMIAGRGTPDQAPARLFAYNDAAAFDVLMDVLVEASTGYLVRQLQAGADAVQIFDTWAGVLPPEQFDRWCIGPTKRIVAGVREQVPGAKIIGFPRGAGTMLPRYVDETGVDAVGLDWMIDRAFARDHVQSDGAGAGKSRSAGTRGRRRRARSLRRCGARGLRARALHLQSRPRHRAARRRSRMSSRCFAGCADSAFPGSASVA